MSDFAYLATKPCGCVIGAAVIGSIEPKELGTVVGKWISANHQVDRVAVGAINLHAMSCRQHRQAPQLGLFDGIAAAAAEAVSSVSTQRTEEPAEEPDDQPTATGPDGPAFRINPEDYNASNCKLIEAWRNDEGALCDLEVSYVLTENVLVRPGYGIFEAPDGKEIAILLDADAPMPDLHNGRLCLQCLANGFPDDRVECPDCELPLYWRVLMSDAELHGPLTERDNEAAETPAEEPADYSADEEPADEEDGTDD